MTKIYIIQCKKDFLMDDGYKAFTKGKFYMVRQVIYPRGQVTYAVKNNRNNPNHSLTESIIKNYFYNKLTTTLKQL